MEKVLFDEFEGELVFTGFEGASKERVKVNIKWDSEEKKNKILQSTSHFENVTKRYNRDRHDTIQNNNLHNKQYFGNLKDIL